jgi:hypothetical protein
MLDEMIPERALGDGAGHFHQDPRCPLTFVKSAGPTFWMIPNPQIGVIEDN